MLPLQDTLRFADDARHLMPPHAYADIDNARHRRYLSMRRNIEPLMPMRAQP